MLLENRYFKGVVFDWDGTLADSLGGIVASMQEAAKVCGLEEKEALAIRPLIGLGLDTVIMSLYPALEPKVCDEMIVAYKQAYLNTSPCVLYEGVELLLQSLKDSGKYLAIATGKSRAGLERALQETGIKHYFLSTKTPNECFAKPHPQMLEDICLEWAIETHEAVMIGDALCDMQMAKQINMPGIAVMTGSVLKDALIEAGAVSVIESIDCLL